MAYCYVNRHGKVHYFREAATKTGKLRYYVTTSDQYPNLIGSIPDDYEIAELPEDARVVIRKKKPVLIHSHEIETVVDIISKESAINDFFIYTEEAYLSVYHSQFNYAGGQEPNLSREEAKEYYGVEIEKWMRFFTSLRFRLVDKRTRYYQAERVVSLGIFDRAFFPVGDEGKLEDLAKEFGQHLGKESFFSISPHTE
ncbi:MAG: hypothetical protein AAF655_23865 [Bacteroidota bacterium]